MASKPVTAAEKIKGARESRLRRAVRVSDRDLLDPGFRVAVWDIEAGGLAATFSGLLVVGIKPLREEARILRIDEFAGWRRRPWNDRALAYAAKRELERYHLLVSYNGLNYDAPYLNTRLVFHGIKPLDRGVAHLDLYRTVRARLRLHSNRLAALQEFLDTQDRKTPLTPQVWHRAVSGDRAALDEIVEHNRHDLGVLEEAFLKLVRLFDLRFAWVD